MTRKWTWFAVVALALLSAGCSMCAGPYDYCGPVVEGPYGGPVGFNERVGSAIAPAGFDGVVSEPGSYVVEPDADFGPTLVPTPDPNF